MISIMKKHSKRVVVIGGGTGSSVILRGLKHFTENITAIVTVADDESIMQQLLNYRFTDGMLKGQSFGNLFLAAMNGISGNFMEAVKRASDVMAIKGTVLPISLDAITLHAKLHNGETINGESVIPVKAIEQQTKIKEVSISPANAKPLPDAIEAIMEAQVVIIGPGSLYTSIIPNLLVEGMVEALIATRAKRFYIPNIMTQPGETDDYDVWDHVKAIETHVNCGVEPIFDYIVVNRGKELGQPLEKYQKGGANRVRFLEERFAGTHYTLILDDFTEVKGNYIRHNAYKLAEVILEKV